MTDRQVKIRIVIRGPRSSVDGDTGDGRLARVDSSGDVVATRRPRAVGRRYGIAAVAVTAMVLAGWWLISGDPDAQVAELSAPTVPEPPPESTPTSLPTSLSAEATTLKTTPRAQDTMAPVTITAIVDPSTVEFAELSSGQLPADTLQADASTIREGTPANPFVEYLRRRSDIGDSVDAETEQKPPSASPPAAMSDLQTVTPPSPTNELQPATDDRVRRAQFTTGMRNREPVDELGSDFVVWPEAPERLYFFTELRGLTGKSVSHKWLRDGKLMATVNFQVLGPRWRVYSSKLITASMPGDWSVRVEDSAGNLLEAGYFRVTLN